MRRPRLRLRSMLFSMMLSLLWIGSAVAHAQLLTSTPAPNAVLISAPQTVQLAFNEAVTPLSVVLVATDSARTDLTSASTGGTTLSVRLPDGIGTGTHVLSWRAASTDGHPVAGSLIFSIGATTGAAVLAPGDQFVPPALWSLKTLLFITLFLAVGGAVFGLVASLPHAASAAARVAAVVGLVLAPLSLGLHGVDALGLPLPDLLDGQTWAAGASTSYGLTVMAIVVALALTLLALNVWSQAAYAAWLVAAAALAASGHASVAEPQWLTRTAVFLHIGGVVFWVGALVPLSVYLASDSAEARKALDRFSRAIPFAVLPIVLSGVTLAIVQLGPFDRRWLSPYGGILAAKVALLVGLFALAAWNRLSLTRPALTGDQARQRELRLSVRSEIVLVLIILGLVAGWRFTPPPRSLPRAAEAAVPESIFVHMMAGTVFATVTISPGRAGPVTIAVETWDAEATAATPREVTIALSAPALGIEPLRLPATAVEGHWEVQGLSIPVAGPWHVEVDVRIDTFTLVRLSQEVSVY